MNKKMALCLLAVLVLFPALVRAQTVEDPWGRDDGGRAIVAVLPLAGEETATAPQFYGGIMDAVAGLQTYTPREAASGAFSGGGGEIPTDMPPHRDLAPGARYALTGGIYPGSRGGEYYLQLWLWDMRSSTMIYTDDLVYEDAGEAMESIPGLVEWLFSHIRMVPVEPPGEVKPARRDPLFLLGIKAGLSPRWYVDPDEISPGSKAVSVDGGVFGSLRLGAFFSLQAEILLFGDTLVDRGVRQGSGTEGILVKDTFRNFSLMIPLLFKVDFRPGPFRLSPLAGLYAIAPLGKTRYRRSTEATGYSFSWSTPVPLGFTLGLEGAVESGPGFLVAGMRYSGDIGVTSVDYGGVSISYGGNSGSEKEYRRRIFSLYVGYAFGFSGAKK